MKKVVDRRLTYEPIELNRAAPEVDLSQEQGRQIDLPDQGCDDELVLGVPDVYACN